MSNFFASCRINRFCPLRKRILPRCYDFLGWIVLSMLICEWIQFLIGIPRLVALSLDLNFPAWQKYSVSQPAPTKLPMTIQFISISCRCIEVVVYAHFQQFRWSYVCIWKKRQNLILQNNEAICWYPAKKTHLLQNPCLIWKKLVYGWNLFWMLLKNNELNQPSEFL